MRVALCDNDSYFLQILEEMLRQYAARKELEFLTDCFRNGESLLSQPRDLYDIIFMDIYLSSDQSRLNGIETIRCMGLSRKTQVVFTTTSREHAVEAFSLDATHYLLKPLTSKGVAEALDRCIDRAETQFTQVLEVKTKQGVVSIPMESIVFIEVDNKICQIHTTANCIQTYSSLDSLSELLDPAVFMRAQRSFIVNMKYIDSLQIDRLLMKGGKEIMLSRKTKTDLKEQYQKFLFDLARKGTF